MTYIPRQKRQARSYWAELGFLVMGLFALQPSLLTNLLPGPQNKHTQEMGSQYYPMQGRFQPNGQNWWSNSVDAAYRPLPMQTAMQGLNSNWQPQNNFGWDRIDPNSPSHLATSQFHGQSPQYGVQQPQFPQYSNNWGNQSSQIGSTNNLNWGGPSSNSWASQTVANSNWRNAPSNSYGTSSNPFSSLIGKPSQSSLFGNGSAGSGADSYLSGRTNSAYSPYPTNSNGSNSFVPYRPGNSLYR